VHPRKGRCLRCESTGRPGDGVFWELLEGADRGPLESLVRALADPMSLQAFLQ
jgi:hypothetical protein